MGASGQLALLEHMVEEGINIFVRKYFWHKIHNTSSTYAI